MKVEIIEEYGLKRINITLPVIEAQALERLLGALSPQLEKMLVESGPTELKDSVLISKSLYDALLNKMMDNQISSYLTCREDKPLAS